MTTNLKFMMEREKQPEIAAEKKEYSFKEGVKQIIERIDSLLLVQKYVVVAISGPLQGDINVGKTFLEGILGRRFDQRGIPYILASNENALENRASSKIDNGVIVLGAMGSPGNHISPEKLTLYKTLQDSELEEAASSIGMPLSKIDIRVVIYRPDRPLGEGDRQYSDIIIRNEQAVDK